MTLTFRYLATVLFTLAVVGCGAVGPVGNGKLAPQAREVPPFKRLSVGGGVKVTFTTGPRAVLLTTDENLLGVMRVEVVDGVLFIRPRQPLGFSTRLTAAVSGEALEGLLLSGGSGFSGPATAADEFVIDASGGSTAEVAGISSKNVIATASGGSTVTFTGGSTSSLFVAASGGSKFSAHSFVAADVGIEASGGSEICVLATRQITGNASGGSTVNLAGSPATNRVISSGGARLVKLD